MIGKVRLGKRPVKHDARTFKLVDILEDGLLEEFDCDGFDWDSELPEDTGVMMNDRVGLCAVAAYAHLEQGWTALEEGAEYTMPDDVVVSEYSRITGIVNGTPYTPSDPTTDTGLALLDVMKVAKSTGIGGRKIGAFVKLNHQDMREIVIAGYLFGGLYTGAGLPVDASDQIGKMWTPTTGSGSAPYSWGGHAMGLVAASKKDGWVRYRTWGKRQDADEAWVSTYADEMYACLADDWVSGDKPAPNGVDMKKLRALLMAL